MFLFGLNIRYRRWRMMFQLRNWKFGLALIYIFIHRQSVYSHSVSESYGRAGTEKHPAELQNVA